VPVLVFGVEGSFLGVPVVVPVLVSLMPMLLVGVVVFVIGLLVGWPVIANLVPMLLGAGGGRRLVRDN
jgi:hypothetical protein